MPHKVFISHAQRDSNAANAIVAHLEQAGVACWIAPRNIMPGSSWPKAIVAAINTSLVMVLVFSKYSNKSEHVQREVELAIKRGITVVPVRIEDCVPEGELEFFLSSAHWMDAITPPLERHLQNFGLKVRAVLENPTDTTTSSAPADAASPAFSIAKNRVAMRMGGIAILIVIALGIGLMTQWGGNSVKPSATGNRPAASELAKQSNLFNSEDPSDDSRQAPEIDPQVIADMDDFHAKVQKGNREQYLLRRGPIRFRAWMKAAEAGFGPAQYAISMLYWDGIGVQKNEESVIEWVQRAADQNHPEALNALGYMYDIGYGEFSINPDTAVSYYTAAAEASSVGGMRNLGWCYRNGNGPIAKDWKQSIEWYGKAAELGYHPAMRSLAEMYDAGNEEFSPDQGLSQTWFQRAAEAGNPYAQAALFSEPFNAALIKYAETIDDEGSKDTQVTRKAFLEIESLIERYQRLQFEAQLDIMSNWRIADSVKIIEAKEDDPVRSILERMNSRMIDQFGSSHRVLRQRTLYTYAGATLSTLERWEETERWRDIILFWDKSYADLSLEFTPPKEHGNFVRGLRICTLALYNQGRRDEASELVDTMLAMQDEHMQDRPWDWYAKEAYRGYGFQVAKMAELLGDHKRSQDLLYRSWSLLFGRFGLDEYAEKHKGQLPQKNTLPMNMPDDSAVMFLRFAADETKEKFKSKSSVAIPSGGMKRFTVPVDFGGIPYPFHIYVLDGPRGYLELQDQFRWVLEYRGGLVPEDVQTSFKRLYKIATENDVSFMDLCVYALGTVDKEKNNELDDPTGSDD